MYLNTCSNTNEIRMQNRHWLSGNIPNAKLSSWNVASCIVCVETTHLFRLPQVLTTRRTNSHICLAGCYGTEISDRLFALLLRWHNRVQQCQTGRLVMDFTFLLYDRTHLLCYSSFLGDHSNINVHADRPASRISKPPRPGPGRQGE